MADVAKLSRIEIDINIDEIPRKLAELKRQFQELQKKTNKISSRRSGLIQQKAEINAKLKKGWLACNILRGYSPSLTGV